MTGPDRTPDRYVTVAQAADLTGAQPRTIRRWISRGHLAVRSGPFGRLVELGAVERLVAERLDGDKGRDSTFAGPDRIGPDQGLGQDRTAIRNGPDSDNVYLVNISESLGELVTLLREKDQTILELAGRCGWLQAENQRLQEEVRLLSAPSIKDFIVATDPASAPTSYQSGPEQNGPVRGAECPARRPWWRFWARD